MVLSFFKKKSGFTLIELLIVVAIIAILAAIAIPNFLAAQIRAQVSRTQADMRSIATGLESYYVDSNKYPWAGLAYQQHSFNSRLIMLTTPVAYMSSIPPDPFAIRNSQFPFPSQNGVATYEYADRESAIAPFLEFAGTPPDQSPVFDSFFTSNTQWYLVSNGPDQRNVFQLGYSVPAGATNYVTVYTYDPSNGTVSNGDIWRYGP